MKIVPSATGEAASLESGFDDFSRAVYPRLVRALTAAQGQDAQDGAQHAMVFAWENWASVQAMANPVGYLYRVAQSKSRQRRVPRLFGVSSPTLPDFEPDLVAALKRLPRRQREVVWLVHACGWKQVEVSETLGISASAVSTHLARALKALRADLRVDPHETGDPS